MKYQYNPNSKSSDTVNQVAEPIAEYKIKTVSQPSAIAHIDTKALGITDKKGGIDIAQQLSQLEQNYQQAQLQLLAQLKNQQQDNQVPTLLDTLGDFDDNPGITRLELIRRYAVLRKQVRDTVEFVGAKELANLLDENKTNWTRDLANLYKKNKILATRRISASNWEYPINQIDPVQGAVYPALEARINDFKAQGLSDWDILIWLNLPNTIEHDANPVRVNKNETLGDLLADFDSRQPPAPEKQVLPIELLQQGKIGLFNHQAECFLHPEFGG